jgi:LysR family transcriptional activator of nhaA
MGECDDSALLKTLGQAGHGLFPAPVVIAREVCRQYNVVLVGTIAPVIAQYYVISAERRLKHPGIVAMTAAGRKLFA